MINDLYQEHRNNKYPFYFFFWTQNLRLEAMVSKDHAQGQLTYVCIVHVSGEAMACEDRARAAMIDAAKLAEELRAEQDVTAKAEYARKMADAQIKDLQNKVI